MIVQTAPTNKPHFVITMAEHCQFAAQFAQAFGNDRFFPPPHRMHLERLIAHHDRGWADYDRHPGLNPDTGLPYSLQETPIPDIVPTSALSPDLNQQDDPYNGLLSSMHSPLFQSHPGLGSHPSSIQFGADLGSGRY